MADDTQAKEAEMETQPEAVPTSEQQTSKPKEVDKDVEATQVSEPTDKGDELPEGAKDRTKKQFDKLKKQLADERQRRFRLERTFKPTQTEAKPDWYDPNTGTVDVAKLTAREQALQQKLSKVETQLQGVSRQSEAQQEKEAYVSYPELNPNRKTFDEPFQEAVINHMATAFAKGKSPTLKEAADSVMGLAKKMAKKAEKKGATKALEQLSPKEQASLEATGRSDRRLPKVNLEQLRDTTRRGGTAGIEAAMQRISKLKPVGK